MVVPGLSLDAGDHATAHVAAVVFDDLFAHDSCRYDHSEAVRKWARVRVRID